MNENIIEKERHKTLSRIALLVEASISRLREANFPQKMGIFTLGDFEVELSVGPHGTSFDLWRKEDKDRLSTRLTSNKRSFVMTMGDEKMMLSDDAGLCIEEFVNSYSSYYPHIQSKWTGEERPGISKGTLVFLKVDLSNSVTVAYQYIGQKYTVINGKKLDLSEVDLPEKLEEVSEIMGMPLRRTIDFDECAKELLKMSELEEVAKEIYVKR